MIRQDVNTGHHQLGPTAVNRRVSFPYKPSLGAVATRPELDSEFH